MITDGEVMQSSKSDFDELILRSMVHEVDPHEALTMLDEGATLIDVRLREEWEEMRIYHSVNIPLHALRDKVKELDKSKKYVLCCFSGELSTVAAILMKQRDFNDVHVLQCGLRFWPYDIIDWKALI